MDTLTGRFAEHILDIRYEALPREAIDIAKQVTLDGLAVTLAGATEPLGVGRISIEYVKAMGGAPQASVVAGGFKTSMVNAAYANGTMAMTGNPVRNDAASHEESVMSSGAKAE